MVSRVEKHLSIMARETGRLNCKYRSFVGFSVKMHIEYNFVLDERKHSL